MYRFNAGAFLHLELCKCTRYSIPRGGMVPVRLQSSVREEDMAKAQEDTGNVISYFHSQPK